MDPPHEITPGLRFRHVIADERVLWQVDEPLGKGYWECSVIPESGDYGEDFARAFHADQILGALRIDAVFGGYDPANYEPKELR